MSGNPSYVVLDGEYVSDELIDPAKHRYIGIFRPPRPIAPSKDFWTRCCPYCHVSLSTSLGSNAHQHWQKGCFDVPQYVSLKEGEA